MALGRLTSAGLVRRFARGLYDKPRINPLTRRETLPDTREVIEAVTRRSGLKYVVDGLTAANDLGLDDAVPARIVVHVNARIAPIKVGDIEITFKPASGTRLYWAGRPAMRLVQALDWLQDRLPRDGAHILARIDRLLQDPVHGDSLKRDLQDGLHVLPIWMRELLRSRLTHAPKDLSDSDASPEGPKP